MLKGAVGQLLREKKGFLRGQTACYSISDVKDQHLLFDEGVLRLLIERIVEAIDMTLVPDSMKFWHFPIPLKGYRGEYGVSGGAILVESHIYLHTWPERRFMRLEISSCKQFNWAEALEVIRNILGRKCKIRTTNTEW